MSPTYSWGGARVVKVYLGSDLKYQYSYVPPEPPGYHLFSDTKSSVNTMTLTTASSNDSVKITTSGQHKNGVKTVGSIAGSGSLQFASNRITAQSNTWFNLRNGDVLKLVVTSTGTNSGSSEFHIGLIDTGATDLSIDITGSKTPSNICTTYTTTVSGSHTVACLGISHTSANKGTTTSNFTIKLYVNDVLYVGY